MDNNKNEIKKLVKERLELLYQSLKSKAPESNFDEEFEDGYIKVFDDENDDGFYEISDFLYYTTDLNSIKQTDDFTVSCENTTQVLIDCTNYDVYDLLSTLRFVNDRYEATFVKEPFLIGYVSLKEKYYDNNYFSPCGNELALEFRYKGETASLNDEISDTNRIFFFIATEFGINLRKLKLSYRVDYEDYIYEENDSYDNQEEKIINTSSIVKSTPMLSLYLQALNIEDDEIKFLHFYKIIEYISPIIARSAIYERLYKKIDSLGHKRPNHEFLDNLISVVKRYYASMKDSELSSLVIDACADIPGLVQYLPKCIKEKVSKIYVKEENRWDEENINKDVEKRIKDNLAAFLTSTRNSIVHAKSNYTMTGYECPKEDLPKLNELMEHLCYSIIKWNDRQPEGLKM